MKESTKNLASSDNNKSINDNLTKNKNDNAKNQKVDSLAMRKIIILSIGIILAIMVVAFVPFKELPFIYGGF